MDVIPGSPLWAAVESVAGRPVERVEGAHHESLEYDAFLAHRSVGRIRGVAIAGGEHIRWSLIEKITEGPQLASGYLVDNGRRELEAYRSGLLDDLGPRVRAPRAHGTLLEPDGRTTLWLEEGAHEGSRPLEAEDLLTAAHDLGTLAGHWLGRAPSAPWIFTGWIARHSQPEAVDEAMQVLSHPAPVAVERIGPALAPARELIAAQDRLRRILESQPPTLCHHDAVGANVFRSGGGTVLIDWESVGTGPAGADLASLLIASPRRGDCSAHTVREVLDDALDAYLEGLREQTRAVDSAAVRRTFDAATGLRWKLVRDVAATLADGAPARRGSAPHETPEQAMEELTVLIGIVLDAAGRALEADG